MAASVTARGGSHRSPASQAKAAIDQPVSDTYDQPGLTTGLAASGDIVVYGFDDGNVLVYDAERDGEVLSLGVDRAVSHLLVREPQTAIVAWMDADRFSPLDLDAGAGPLIKHRGLWDIDATADGDLIASVSYPADAAGSVGVTDGQGSVLWSAPLKDAAGSAVALADEGEYVAVGAAHHWDDGTEPTGQPGIRLYDDTGTELWHHDHDEDVLSVGISTAHEVVTAGTDDGRTIVLDLEGNLLWESEEYSGWIALSGDGETILSSEPDGTLVALESTTGEERWSTDVDMWAGEDLSVSDDGHRSLVVDRGEGEFVLVEEGETIWTESHDVGPGRGALAGDGSAWSTIVTDLEAETSLVQMYRDPEAVRETEPTRGDDAASEGDGATDEDSSDGEDDPSDEDESTDEADDPTGRASSSLALVEYDILGNDPDEEYITLRNTGDESLEMTGWTLRDREDGGRVGVNLRRFDFPSGFTLEPGADVTIVSGQGEDTDETLYWGEKRQQVWNEDGDLVIVQNAAGEVVLEAPITANDNDENTGSASGDLTVVIDQTNAPVEGGEHLQVVATLTNEATAERTDTIELVVGGEVVDSQSVTVAGEATHPVELGYTTYPVDQDVSFEVTVRTSDDSASTTVSVTAASGATDDDDGGESEAGTGEPDQDDSDEPATEPDDENESGAEDPADPEDESGESGESDAPPEEPAPEPEAGTETPADESPGATGNDTGGGTDE
ncbi:lamin tail domain-containing protein [Natronosalvus rutilus]|uniref:Lamin tail domain-containing protein n=1 Tax=Natronosalvus rutilus TaxID=2953753 RepID=A0A9E7NDN1_9EURY|nr:lamin tail domain-containing protein [Natronosalvus rutilus]UTF54817.1 lamin tail domain-containing protein [Natronosalvus rutilus]